MNLSIAELAERCRIETERFRQEGASDPDYCFQLFRQALVEQSKLAWEAICRQYESQVTKWVRKHSQFYVTNEESEFFVNDAFVRMWKSFANQSENVENRLINLASCIQYLKTCAWSSIKDYLKKSNKDALSKQADFKEAVFEQLYEDKQIDRNLDLEDLWQVIDQVVEQNEKEQIVCRETWKYGLAPRQIMERHPDKFASAEAVSKEKNNVLRRLKRHPKIEKFKQEWLRND